MGSSEGFARAAARAREELGTLDRVFAALGSALDKYDQAPQEPMVVHWVAGLLHDLYTGIERIFRQIAGDVNGAAHDGVTWHRDLLHSMTLDLRGVRPAVVRREREVLLAELLRFRHVFRNLYTLDLDWRRVRPLAQRATAEWPAIRGDLVSFADAIDGIVAG